MRRILSANESEKKKKRNVAILGILLLVIMVVSSLGYAFLMSGRDSNGGNGDSANPGEPEEGKVISAGNLWATKFQGKTVYFSNSLESAKEVDVNIMKNLQDYYGEPLYIVSKNQGVSGELGNVFIGLAAKVQSACYGPCEDNLPEKNCTEANLIVWKESAENKVYQEEKCIFIEGDLKAVDAFLYKILDLI